MEKIRKGNDIEILWAIYVGQGINEAPYNLAGRNLSLYIKNRFGRVKVEDFTVNGHILKFFFWGKDQKHTGDYSIELVENEGLKDMHTVDECNAFRLVNCSCETDHDPEGRVECIHLQFRAQMSVGFPSSGGDSDIVVDNVLSESSENPVQNKVVTSAINDLKTSLSGLSASVSNLSDKVEGYSEDIANAAEKSEEATEAVKGITNQINDIIEEVGSLSDKVESLENGEITWTDVQ